MRTSQPLSFIARGFAGRSLYALSLYSNYIWFWGEGDSRLFTFSCTHAVVVIYSFNSFCLRSSSPRIM